MSMLEKMARRLALDALDRVQPDTFTNVIDTIDLTKNEDGNYQVGERISYGDKSAPWLDYDAARETMVAMMAAQAGALVVVPEEAPGDPYLAQIAQLLVNSADVPTDAQDVADGAAIVGTVKDALSYLDAARDDNRIKREKIAKLELLLEESRKLNATGQVEIERLNDQIQRWNIGTNELQDKYLAAQHEIGALTAKLEAATRKNDRFAVELGESLTRYEGLRDALHMAMDKLAGVGK